MTHQLADGEIAAPTHDDGPSAWLELTASLGSLGSKVDTLVRQGDQRRRERVDNIKAPIMASAIVTAAGTALLDLTGPARGRQWSVRRLLVLDSTATGPAPSTGSPTAASGTFTAASAGSILLPAGASMTGFDATVAPAAAVVTGLLTATGLAVGNLNYEISQGTGGTTLSVRFPGPLAPTTPTGVAQVNMPAITSGAAYAMTVYGTTSSSVAAGSGWAYTGNPGAFSPLGAAAPITSLPYSQTYSGEQITVLPADRLFISITGATPGHQIIARADVIDAVQGAAYTVENL